MARRREPPNTKYISTSEAARRIGKTPHTIRSWASQGRLRSTRSGGRDGEAYIYVCEEDVQRLEHESLENVDKVAARYAGAILEQIQFNRSIAERIVETQEGILERLDTLAERSEEASRGQSEYQETVKSWLDRLDPARIRIDPPEGSGEGPISVFSP